MVGRQDAYDNLLTGILLQAIQDYVTSKRNLLAGRKVSQRYNLERRLKSCETFFNKPPYDYGDIDLTKVKALCDEKVLDGKRVFYKDLDFWK